MQDLASKDSADIAEPIRDRMQILYRLLCHSLTKGNWQELSIAFVFIRQILFAPVTMQMQMWEALFWHFVAAQ